MAPTNKLAGSTGCSGGHSTEAGHGGTARRAWAVAIGAVGATLR